MLGLLDYFEYSSDANAQAAYVTNAVGDYLPTGGTITTDGEYKVHKFTIHLSIFRLLLRERAK